MAGAIVSSRRLRRRRASGRGDADGRGADHDGLLAAWAGCRPAADPVACLERSRRVDAAVVAPAAYAAARRLVASAAVVAAGVAADASAVANPADPAAAQTEPAFLRASA